MAGLGLSNKLHAQACPPVRLRPYAAMWQNMWQKVFQGAEPELCQGATADLTMPQVNRPSPQSCESTPEIQHPVPNKEACQGGLILAWLTPRAGPKQGPPWITNKA